MEALHQHITTMTIISRQTIAAEVMRQDAIHPEDTSDEVVLQAVADKMGITVDLVAEAIGRKELAQ